MAISYTKHILSNGLTLLIHEDHSTPLVSFHLVYEVGSKHEDPSLTGLAHLLEHFMFDGSVNVPDFDAHIQKIGGSCNAYTSKDMTGYHALLPAQNLETILWLESDRMLSLAFDEEKFVVQKNVVLEEFNERYLNKPFGDLSHQVSELVFQVHPYQWQPIGKERSHVEKITMDNLKQFYNRFYTPSNAVIAIAGHIKVDEVIRLVEKWFGTIPSGKHSLIQLPQEPEQKEPRLLKLQRDVPVPLVYKMWSIPSSPSKEYYSLVIWAEILGGSDSGYLHEELVHKQKLCVDAYTFLNIYAEASVLFVAGVPNINISVEQVNQALNDLVYSYQAGERLSYNLQRVKNKVVSDVLYDEILVQDKSSRLAVREAIAGVEQFENEIERYLAVTEEEMLKTARQWMVPHRENTLFYDNFNK